MIEKIPKNSYQKTQEDRDKLLVDCTNKINELIKEINKIKRLLEPTSH